MLKDIVFMLLLAFLIATAVKMCDHDDPPNWLELRMQKDCEVKCSPGQGKWVNLSGDCLCENKL